VGIAFLAVPLTSLATCHDSTMARPSSRRCAPQFPVIARDHDNNVVPCQARPGECMNFILALEGWWRPEMAISCSGDGYLVSFLAPVTTGTFNFRSAHLCSRLPAAPHSLRFPPFALFCVLASTPVGVSPLVHAPFVCDKILRLNQPHPCFSVRPLTSP